MMYYMYYMYKCIICMYIYPVICHTSVCVYVCMYIVLCLLY